MKECIIPKGSKLYPQGLYDMPSPIEKLYCIGETECLSLDKLGIIGPRKTSKYSLECTKRFAHQAGRCGYIVLTGGNLGTGEAAAKAAIESGCRTIAVVPALSERTPLHQHVLDNGGLLVSPFPFEKEYASPEMYRFRSKVLVALSNALLLCGGGRPSGSVSDALAAQSMGRRVLTVPGPIDDPLFAGSNSLLGNPAHAVCSEEDLTTQLLCASLAS